MLGFKAVLSGGNVKERSGVIAGCWNQAMDLEDRWLAQLGSTTSIVDTAYCTTWDNFSRLADMPM